jgi:hypothetical protein
MSDYAEASERERRWTYWVALGLLGVLILIALLTFSSARSTQEARDKADQLIAALESEGLTPPSEDQIVNVLGEDGGALCEDPGNALRQAITNNQLANGAAGPGLRPILADAAQLLKGELLALEIYCPEELPDFQRYVDDLQSENVTEG